MTSARHRVLLVAVLALALFHALAQARVRPMYQASDEINYIFEAQYLAGEQRADVARTCLYPPDGERFHLWAGSGKPGFRYLAAWQLSTLCTWQPDAFPLFPLRALQAVALPVVAWAAWYLAVLVTGRARVGILAALLVALHPVAAVQAGTVSPDAWANGWAALALVAGARLVLDVHRWWDVPALMLTTIAALLWKDTTNFLVMHLGLVLLVAGTAAVLRSDRPTSDARRRLWLLGAALAVVGAGAALFWRLSASLVSPYLLGYDALGAVTNDPVQFARLVLQDALVAVPGLVLTAVTAIGSFGASALTLPFTASVVGLTTLAAGVTGLVVALVRTPLEPRRRWLAAVWVLSAIACLLQPSIRQILLNTTDTHQGRWLLPMLAPAAACLAAGLAIWLRRWSSVQPVLLVWLSTLGLTWLAIVAHFYETFPGALSRSALFLRTTGGHVVDDVRVLEAVEQTLAAQSAVVTWSILVALLAAALVVCVEVARAATRPDHV